MSVYELITEMIVALLNKGVVPWKKPWRGHATAPQNLISRKNYRGINALLLACMPYRSPYWLTYKQAQQLGGHVRRGERSCPIVFWRWVEREGEDSGEVESFPVLRYYHVFNAQQCQLPGEVVPLPPAIVQPAFRPIASCEKVVREMPLPPHVVHGGDCACYAVARTPSTCRDENSLSTANTTTRRCSMS